MGHDGNDAPMGTSGPFPSGASATGVVGAVVLASLVQSLKYRMLLSGTLGSSHTRRVRRSPSHSVTQATVLIGHDGGLSRASLEFAFLGGLSEGTMLARSPSKDGKKRRQSGKTHSGSGSGTRALIENHHSPLQTQLCCSANFYS